MISLPPDGTSSTFSGGLSASTGFPAKEKEYRDIGIDIDIRKKKHIGKLIATPFPIANVAR